MAVVDTSHLSVSANYIQSVCDNKKNNHLLKTQQLAHAYDQFMTDASHWHVATNLITEDVTHAEHWTNHNDEYCITTYGILKVDVGPFVVGDGVMVTIIGDNLYFEASLWETRNRIQEIHPQHVIKAKFVANIAC